MRSISSAAIGSSPRGWAGVRVAGFQSAYELRVVILLGLAFGFAYFDRMALTFLAPFVQADLNLSNEELGWANSGLSLTWALGAYLIGRWSDLSGKRKPFLIGALLMVYNLWRTVHDSEAVEVAPQPVIAPALA